MTNPCQIGLKCPHMICAEGDLVCIHPYTRENCPEDETFGIIECVDCLLVEYPSPIHDLLWLHHTFSNGTSPSEQTMEAEYTMKAMRSSDEQMLYDVFQTPAVLHFMDRISRGMEQYGWSLDKKGEYYNEYSRVAGYDSHEYASMPNSRGTTGFRENALVFLDQVAEVMGKTPKQVAKDLLSAPIGEVD